MRGEISFHRYIQSFIGNVSLKEFWKLVYIRISWPKIKWFVFSYGHGGIYLWCLLQLSGGNSWNSCRLWFLPEDASYWEQWIQSVLEWDYEVHSHVSTVGARNVPSAGWYTSLQGWNDCPVLPASTMPSDWIQNDWAARHEWRKTRAFESLSSHYRRSTSQGCRWCLHAFLNVAYSVFCNVSPFLL